MSTLRNDDANQIPVKDLLIMLAAAKTAITIVNTRNGCGDKPRVVGVELSTHPMFEQYKNLFGSEFLSFGTITSFCLLWDKAVYEECIAYQLEMWKEFNMGLSFFDEAISY